MPTLALRYCAVSILIAGCARQTSPAILHNLRAVPDQTLRAEIQPIHCWRSKYDALFENKAELRHYALSPRNANWSAAYVLHSLWKMYEVAGETRYLDELILQADLLLTKSRNFQWPTARNSSGGEDAAWLVHSASLLHPILLAAGEMRRPEFRQRTFNGRTYRELSEEWIRFARTSLARFDSHRVEHVETFGPCRGERTMYYAFPANFSAKPQLAGTLYPYNMQNAAGRCFLVIHDITGDSAALACAEGLARFLRNRLGTFRDARGEVGYLWGYRPRLHGAFPDGTKAEDIGHADHTVEFIVEAAHRGLVFTAEDCRRAACTIRRIAASAVARAGPPAFRIDNVIKNERDVGTWLDLFDLVERADLRGELHTAVEEQARSELQPFARHALNLAQFATGSLAGGHAPPRRLAGNSPGTALLSRRAP